MLSKLHEHELLILMTCPVCAVFMCVCFTRNKHQNYFELDAAAYIIGVSVKNWVRKCLLSVDGGCMGSIMLWFAFRFIMSDALFQDFLCVRA